MNPDAHKLWLAPQWAFAVLLALLGMLGPFSIDTYLPAFAGIAESLDAKQETVRVLIQEMPKEHFGIGGVSAKELGR